MGRRSSHTNTPKRRPPKATRTPGRRTELRVWPFGAALLLLGALAYANSLDGAFIIDDYPSIVENPDIRTPWSLSLLRSAWGESALLGRPLAALTFAINYAVDGLDVRGYHVGNILVHLLCGLALFGVIRRVHHSVIFAFACASIWLLHPLNNEVVNYISQRTESMMALFYFSTIYASVRAHREPRPRPWLAAAVAATVLGTLSKQSMVTVPLAIVLVDYAFFFDSLPSALRTRWRFYLAVTAAAYLVVGVTVFISPQFSSVGFSSGPSPWVYLLNQSVMITRYLTLTLWPRDLVSDYGSPFPYTLMDVLPHMAFISGLVVLTAIALRYRPKLGFLGAWVFLTLGLTSSFAPMANEAGAERRMYLPLAALVVLGMLPFARLAQHLTRHERVPSKAVAIGCVVLWALAAAALGARTFARNRDYSSPLRLAQITFERWPTGHTRNGLAEELLAAGRRDEAVAHLREAIRDNPRAHFTYGRVLFEDGHLRDAREQLEAFVGQRPLAIEAVEARFMIGRSLFSEGRLGDATGQFQQVVQMQPSFFDAYLGLAEVFAAQERYGDAVTQYVAYFARGGASPGVWTHLGIALARAGRPDEAIQTFQRAIERDPRAPDPHRNLAAMLMERGDVAAAVLHAERAVMLSPGDAASRDLLGVALATQGRMDEAAHQFREALRLDPSDATARQRLKEISRQP
jgi:tetratricopeptide (TPR) repeat protein